jgi:hypothetical protein
MPQCEARAVKGISAPGWDVRFPDPVTRDLVVISLGSNPAPGTSRALRRIRERINAQKVVWIVPTHANGLAVLTEASQHADRVVWFRAGQDGIHPRSYAAIRLRIVTN